MYSVLTFATASTLGSEHAMVIVDAVNLVIHIHGEGHSVQTLVADAAAETTGMVRLPHGL